MAIYIAVFTASTILFKIGDYTKKKQRVFLDIIAILLLCLLAGFRSEMIGTDTRGYIQSMIKGAISSDSIKEFFQFSWGPSYSLKTPLDYEIGYTLVVYFASKIFKSIVVTQTILEMLVVLPIYCALRKKEDVPIWFGMLVFMLQFFNGSMNLNRQAIAMSFMLLAITYWMKDDKKKCILFLICAVLFHTSGLLGIAIIVLYEYVGKDRSSRLKTFNVSTNYMNMVIAIAAGVIALIGIRLVAAILTQLGLSYYTAYILGDIHFMPNQVINVLPPIIMLVFSIKNFQNDKNECVFYVVMMAYTIIAGQFTSVNAFGGRIRLYFMIFAIFSYPLVCKYSKHKLIMGSAMVAYLMFYWWFYYVLQGVDQTVPYVMTH